MGKLNDGVLALQEFEIFTQGKLEFKKQKFWYFKRNLLLKN